MFQLKATEKFYVEAGPQIGFMLSATNDVTRTTTNGSSTETRSESTDIKSDLNTVDFGLNFGAGYNFTKNVNVGLRYNLGLSNIAKDSPDYKVKNSVFSLAVGYTF